MHQPTIPTTPTKHTKYTYTPPTAAAPAPSNTEGAAEGESNGPHAGNGFVAFASQEGMLAALAQETVYVCVCVCAYMRVRRECLQRWHRRQCALL